MKKLNVVLLFVALFSVANVANADTASEWWQSQCSQSAQFGEYGKLSPTMTVGEAGVLIQVGKPFNVSVRGAMTKHAPLSASDSNVSFGTKTCLSGTPYGESGCPVQGASNQYSYNQEVTVNGEPRDVILRVDDGGVKFPGETAPSKPYCVKLDIYRAPTTYEYSLSIDKASFGSDEAFKVTVDGISWLKANDMGSQIVLERSGAPASSCEYGPNIGRLGVVCQADGIVSCGLLPDTSKPQYLCAATGLDKSFSPKFPNRDGAVTYTLSLRNTYDLFDTYRFIGGSKSITLTKYNENDNGGTTSYGGCAEGEGVNPLSPRNGCVRCQNIPNNWREHIATCGTDTVPLDEYKWRESIIQDDQANWYTQAPTCAMTYPNARNGVACSQALSAVSCTRLDENPKKVYTCTNTTGGGATYHGKVVDAAGNGIGKVKVKPFHPTAAWMGVSCPEIETEPDGTYDFGPEMSKSVCLTLVSAYVDFKKSGYTDKRVPIGTEFDKRILTVTMEQSGAGNSSALTVLPSNATLERTAGSNVVFTLKNGKKYMAEGGIDVCYETVRRDKDAFTPTAIDRTPARPELCPWSADLQNWQGNSDWQVQGDDLRWVINYGPVWDVPGLQVMLAFRKHGTNEVTYATLNVTRGEKASPEAVAKSAENESPAGGGGDTSETPAEGGGVVQAVVNGVTAGVNAVGGAVISVATGAANFIGSVASGISGVVSAWWDFFFGADSSGPGDTMMNV